jgi:hypothetical protein
MDTRDSNTDRNQPLPPRYLPRRRNSFYHAVLIILITTTALLFFFNWYLKIPQGLDCVRMAQRIASALNNYQKTEHKLPPTLESLALHKGRYGVDHFEYWFKGLGGPENIPDGTIIAYCKNPHVPTFSSPWRTALVLYNHQIVVTRFPESEFQNLIKKQKPPEFYFGVQNLF